MPRMSLRSSSRVAARAPPPPQPPSVPVIQQSPQSPPPSATVIEPDPEAVTGVHSGLDVQEESLWCDKCGKLLEEPCWEHASPLRDQHVNMALSTLPDSLIVQQREGMTEKGVFAIIPVPLQTKFGPLEAPIGDEPSCFAIPDEKTNVKYYQLTSDKTANWMKFVRFAEGKPDQNLAVYLKGTEIYFISVKDIAPGDELRVWYSKKYTDSVGHLLQPVTELAQTAASEAEDEAAEPEEDEMAECEDEEEEMLDGSDKDLDEMEHEGADDAAEEEGEPAEDNGEQAADVEMAESHEPEYVSNKPAVRIERIIRTNRPRGPSRLSTGPYTPKVERVIMKKTAQLLSQLSPMAPPKPSRTRATRHPYPHGCAECGLHFRQEELLHLHSFAHVPDEERVEDDEYQCPQCGITRKNVANIVKHVKAHARTMEQLEARRKDCPYCGKEFVNLQKHLESTHKDKVVINLDADEAEECRCKECGFQARTKQAITNHLKKHLEPEKNIRMCVICEETFPFTPTGAADLQQHVETHIIDDNFPCRLCDKKYSTYRGLTDHYGTNHDPSQMCHCEICNREFMTKWRLKRHMLSHSNIFNFMCELCGKQFKSKGQLQKHNKYVHIGQKRLRPSEKGLKKNYKERLRQAYEYSPFKCHTCKVGYRQRGMLLNHVMSRHPETSLDTIPP